MKDLKIPTINDPLRILMSACLSGASCGFDGSTYGDYPVIRKILKYDNVKITSFCPEHFSFGTPRELCDIHGGTGFDVLDGKAKVLSVSGADWTEGILMASEKMLDIAKKQNIELAILMDISAACGSQVIYDGNRLNHNKSYRIGAGVCAAHLIRNGIKVISQRDYASLEILFSKIDPEHEIDPEAKDHHETEWYQQYFG